MRREMALAQAAGLDVALDQAAFACARRGGQLTELRRQVLRLVLEAGQPVGAYALLDRLRGLRAGAAPPTVYRALEFLQEHGLVHKLERLNAYVGCGAAGPHAHPHQFLICSGCGATAEICAPAVDAALAGAAAGLGFTLRRATVEAEGICAKCAAG